MLKIGIVGRIHDAARAKLESGGNFDIVAVDDGPVENLHPAVEGADALLLRTSLVTPELLDRAPKLRVVSRHGVGFDNVPVDYLTQRQIPLAVAATANKVAVAEHAFAMMLALTKQTIAGDYAVRHENWNARYQMPISELAGKRLLLVGFGRISREVAVRARAFAMDIDVFDPFVGDDLIESAGCRRAAMLEDAAGDVDVVSLHMPLNDATRHVFDAGLLGRMRPSAILINTARGGLVDEQALAEALNAGKLAGAGLDVFAEEPPPRGHPLFACNNLVLSPHVAGVSAEAMERMGLEAATNILNILADKVDPEVIVNWGQVAPNQEGSRT